MKLCAGFSLLLACLGCASVVPLKRSLSIDPRTAPSPKVAMLAAAASDTAPTVTVQAVTFPEFIYPADVTNYTWYLQASDDLVNWTNIAGPFEGEPAGDYEVDKTAPWQFYRMAGER